MPVLRNLRRSPVFTASTILTLALGTGANTGAFSAIHKLLLEPLPYPEPARLVSLYETTTDRKPRGVAEANLLDWRRASTSFASMAVYQPRSFGLTLGERDAVTVIQTGMVMASFFPTLGVPPALGRVFSEEEEVAGAHPLVLTHRLWRGRLESAPDAVGRKVWINEEPYTIVGVMPAGFEYPMDTVFPDAFLPLSRRDYCCSRLGSQGAVGRLRPGVSLPAARAELEASAASLAERYPATNRNRSAGLTPLADALHGVRREPLALLLAAAGLLLAIACANAGGLMLARTSARGREIAIRAALGASRWQMARHFLAESLALSVAGCAAGLLAARLVLDVVPLFLPGPRDPSPLPLDRGALQFAAALALGLTVILGLVPLLRARTALALRPSPKSNRLRGSLVVAQVALSVVLLLGAGLLLRSFGQLMRQDPGFETAHALRFGIGIPEARYNTGDKLVEFHRQLLERLLRIPGVESAGAALRSPLRTGAAPPGGTFQVAGAGIPLPLRPRAWINAATPGYFAAMGIPLLAGRDFSWRDDRPRVRRVAIVNRTFAETYLKGRGALGALLDVNWVSDLNPRGSQWEVVGVAGDLRQTGLDRDPMPEIFLSMTQVDSDGAVYAVRGRTDDPGRAKAIAAAVAEQDPRIERVSPQPLQILIERNLEKRAATMRLVGAFGGLALLLTAVGVYGLVAFRAAERSREMAIRIALGATERDVQALLFRYAARLAALGGVLGVVIFLPCRRFVGRQLFGVGAYDPFTWAAVLAMVMAVALLAAGVRTTRVDLLRD